MRPIGVVRSPFTEKFGVPRQARMIAVRSTIELDATAVDPAMLRGLEQVTHLWVVWWFHLHDDAPVHATVRPPRLGGNARLGVFATRAPFRPNPIGLSVVRLVAIDGLRLEVEGLDAIDGTPVLDLKPYAPAHDIVPDARVDWLEPEPPVLPVTFSNAAESVLANHPRGAELRALVVGMLELDPRPGYRRGEPDDREHAMRVLDVDVRFVVNADGVKVNAIDDIGT